MHNDVTAPRQHSAPGFMVCLGWVAILGCVIFAVSILIADFVVPDHDWIADTISDLGAGRYEFIVDIGIYAFSAALIACALLCAHVHFGDRWWSIATIELAMLGLIVFLIGARNEYRGLRRSCPRPKLEPASFCEFGLDQNDLHRLDAL